MSILIYLTNRYNKKKKKEKSRINSLIYRFFHSFKCLNKKFVYAVFIYNFIYDPVMVILIYQDLSLCFLRRF